MFRLPFVSRARFEDAQERIAELKAEIAELKREKNTLTDFVAKHTVGSAIFERETPAPKDPTRTSEPPESDEQKHDALVKEAIKAGYTKPRAIAEYVTRHNEKMYEANRRNIAITAPRAITTAEREQPVVNQDFEAAIAEGQAAAVSSKGA